MFVPFSQSAIKIYEQKNAIKKDYSLGEYYISEEKFKDMSAFQVLPSDIIVSCAGTIGETYILPKEAPIGIINQALMKVALFEYKISEFWRLFFEYILVKDSTMKGAGSAIKNIPPFEYLKKILTPLPPLKEQQRIVTKIEELIPLIEHYGKKQTELDTLNKNIKEQLKKSVLQYAIEGKLVPQDEAKGTAEELLLQIQAEKQKLYEENKLKKKDLEHSTIFKGEDNKYYEKIGKNVTCIDEEIPFDIPKNWRWVRFGQIVKLSMGKTPPRDDSRYWLNAKRNWVSISDMTNYGRIKTTKEQISEEAANSLMRESSPINTLLMSFKLTVGRTAILDIEAYHNEAIVSIYPYIDKKFMLRNYLFYTLPILANIGDSKDAIKGKTLNSKSLNNLLIPLPPLAEQLRIVESIDAIFRCIEKD